MSSNGGGGACFEPRSFDHCELNLCESRKAKQEDERFCACARACMIRCVLYGGGTHLLDSLTGYLALLIMH
jgi:hypothetical protein